jgi:hypothetical protein
MTTKNTGRNQALAAALTLLGASLGVSTPADAASDTTGIWVKDQATSKQHKGEIELQSFTVKHQTPTTGTQIKGETTSVQHKFWNPNATQIKGETTGNQHKGQAPSAMYMKYESSGDEATSNQHKGQAPSAMFLKHNAAPTSNQQKADVHSNQLKLDTPNESH